MVTISEEAILRASGAAPILHTSSTHDELVAAVDDLQLVLATTARPRESRIPVREPREAVERAVAAIKKGERVGLLFGSEKNGLSNLELESATEIVTIPTMPGFSSLNLAQAVLLMCYEWSCGAPIPSADDPDVAAKLKEEEELRRAPLGQLDSLFAFWEEALWESSFFGGRRGVDSSYGQDKGAEQEKTRAAAAMSKLRRVIMRGEPTMGELSLLRGSLQSLTGRYGSKANNKAKDEDHD